MRSWHKYLVLNNHSQAIVSNEAMKYYPKKVVDSRIKEGKYVDKKDFFQVNFEGGARYYHCYHDHLRKLIKKEAQGLSIGSGLSVNELLLNEEGFNIVCSDLQNYWGETIYRLFPAFNFKK